MGGVGQPKESLKVKLVGSLLGETQSPTDGSKALRWAAIQAVAGYDDEMQGVREAGYQAMKLLID